ncbi:hypothetical protein [Actinoplanes sp. NPDC051851]|uniref:hypothetical protein n=1 Tax=Actinoplanes sp. NPDC051851 TaxID=3154753 RepID=UPI0034414568
MAAQILMALVILAVMALGGLAWLASRQRERPGPARAAAGPDPADVAVELVAGAEEVRAAARRAVATADQARDRATEATGVREEAEARYREAQWEARVAVGEPARLLIERAALEAYGRGELSSEQLNRIWERTRTEEPDQNGADVTAARSRLKEALVETVRVRQEAHVAEVAAEVLAEEARFAEEEALIAQVRADAAEGLSGLLEDPDSRPGPLS